MPPEEKAGRRGAGGGGGPRGGGNRVEDNMFVHCTVHVYKSWRNIWSGPGG